LKTVVVEERNFEDELKSENAHGIFVIIPSQHEYKVIQANIHYLGEVPLPS
jgi:hypothetical protein